MDRFNQAVEDFRGDGATVEAFTVPYARESLPISPIKSCDENSSPNAKKNSLAAPAFTTPPPSYFEFVLTADLSDVPFGSVGHIGVYQIRKLDDVWWLLTVLGSFADCLSDCLINLLRSQSHRRRRAGRIARIYRC
jgi:hypothetical protein